MLETKHWTGWLVPVGMNRGINIVIVIKTNVDI